MNRPYRRQAVAAEKEQGLARGGFEAVIPNPKLKFLEQVSEVMRFKHYSLRTEKTYQEWIRRYVLFRKRHRRVQCRPLVRLRLGSHFVMNSCAERPR